MPRGDITIWIRAGAFGLAVLAMMATAIELSQERGEPVASSTSSAARDPLATELERCNSITPASGRDEACERAWAKNRRRFLGVVGRPAVEADTGTAASAPGGRP